ncbi:lipoxygenase [Xylaria flabelliformis]|nr:lipoxygenase [Xylaria flabelliformis]
MKPTVFCVLLSSAAVIASPVPTGGTNDSFTLAVVGNNYKARAAAIEAKRKGWLYEKYPLGGAYYPTGTLANKTISEQQAQWFPIVVEHAQVIAEESVSALAGIIAVSNFTALDDYANTYENQWNMSLPRGPMLGMLTNYTDDRLFSMMRLSGTPYKIQRVQLNEALLFPVDNAASITGGLSLEDLRAQGRLFSTDFSHLKVYTETDLPSSGKYGAGCQAYFYIDQSGDFLPLAVKPIIKGREKSALVYTPEDEPADWLLAKMLLNQNDGYHSTWAHVGQSHSAAEAPYLAAIRSLSDDHPVMGILNRIEKTPWGVRPNLVNGLKSGEAFTGPQYYPWSTDAAVDYVNQLYISGESADFERNYYRSEFKARGLVDSSFGPKLKSFPFYEDTSVITEAIREFMETFINSYYPNDKAVAQDIELQAWYLETKAARVYDFPLIQTRQTIADVLTHQAYLSVIVSNVMSTNGIHLNSMSLPFAPAGFLQPIPSKKGLTEKDLMSFMPTPEGAVWQVSTYVVGHRPMWRDTNETLSHLFDDDTLLARTNYATRTAAAKFKATMMDFSSEVRARTFDENGLSLGMPFIFDALDPNYAPYWSVI